MPLPSYHPYKKFPPVVDYEEVLWKPVEVSPLLWMDDSGEDGTDFNGATLHTTSNIVVPEFCGIMIAFDTSSVASTQIVVEHSANFNNNTGSFLLSVGEINGKIAFGFKASNGYYTNSYPVSAGHITLGLMHNAARNISVYNSGSLVAGSAVDVTGTSFPSTTANLPLYIRARAGGLFPLAGTVREIIITPTVPSLYIRQKIEGYLAHKWDRILGVTTRVTTIS